jgi:hypothetical protein
MMSLDPAITPGRKPERRHAWYTPLTSVAMSAEDQIDGVVVLQLIQNVRRMGQQERETVLCAWRQTTQVGPMQRGIVDTDDGDFPTVRGNERGLIDQEGDLVAIGEFTISIDRHAAVVIVVTQGDKDRRNLAQAGEKSEYMRQSLRHVEQVAGNKDPIGAEFANGGDDEIVSRLIAVEMQIAEMNGPPAGQEIVCKGDSGNLMRGQSDLQVGDQTKEPIERLAETIPDEGTGSIGPRRCASCHPITRSSSIRSEGVTR